MIHLTLRKVLLGFFAAMIFLNAVLAILFHNGIETLIDDGQKTINRTIIGYNELDFSLLCSVMDCSQISSEFDPSLNFIKREDHLCKTGSDIHETPYYFKTSDYTITKQLGIIYGEPTFGITIETKRKEIILGKINSVLVINGMAVLLFIFISVFMYRITKQQDMIEHRKIGEALRDKNMKILTENLHHELNTPVAIIDGTIRTMQSKIDRAVCPRANHCSVGVGSLKEFKFDDVYDSIERINTVLARMSDFKQIIHSNGNRSLYEIFQVPANNMSMYKHHNFTIDLPEDLKKYSLRGTLTNGDLMNIFSSHIRNSIEAKSPTVKVETVYVPAAELLHVFVIDKGTGIRDIDGFIISKKRQDDVFKEGFSTKDKHGESRVENNSKSLLLRYTLRFYFFLKRELTPNTSSFRRGSGLTLNKWILKSNGGDLKLRETSEKGTVFELIIPVKVRK